MNSHSKKSQKNSQKGSASVEFMFAFLLLLWMCLGFIDIVFQGYNGLIIDYGSYLGSRGYIVDEPGGTHWSEGAETVALGTMLHTDIKAYHYARCLHRCPGATCYNVFYVMSKRKA